MKRLNFGTFLVDESNQEACRICQDVAELRPTGKQPILLLGDQGCGKTHLLYSIVNRIKAAQTMSVGLAYIKGQDFPQQVRALIHDPSPIQKKESAILLVDQLESFTDLVEELEGVVRIFLDNNHPVVMASSVHPARLQTITDGLWNVINAGQVIQIAPRGPKIQVEMIRQEARAEAQAKLEAQQREIGRLRASGTAPDASGLAQRLQEAERELAQLRRSAAAQASDSKRAEVVEGELAQVRAENALLAERLAASETESGKARNEANQLLQRAEGLLTQIDANRAVFAAKESAQQQRIRELEQALSEREGFTATAQELAVEQGRRAEAETEAARLKELAEARQGEASELRDKIARLQDELIQAQATQDSLRSELEAAAESRREIESEMEALRRDAAEQVAEAHAQTGELEGQLARLKRAYERACHAGDSAAERMETIGSELSAAALALSGLTGMLRSVGEDAEPRSSDLPDVEALASARPKAVDLPEPAGDEVAAAIEAADIDTALEPDSEEEGEGPEPVEEPAEESAEVTVAVDDTEAADSEEGVAAAEEEIESPDSVEVVSEGDQGESPVAESVDAGETEEMSSEEPDTADDGGVAVEDQPEEVPGVPDDSYVAVDEAPADEAAEPEPDTPETPVEEEDVTEAAESVDAAEASDDSGDFDIDALADSFGYEASAEGGETEEPAADASDGGAVAEPMPQETEDVSGTVESAEELEAMIDQLVSGQVAEGLVDESGEDSNASGADEVTDAAAAELLAMLEEEQRGKDGAGDSGLPPESNGAVDEGEVDPSI